MASNGVAKKKKDPNKPKGAKSAYIFFTEACKNDKHHTSDFALFSKECGRKWKEMSEEEKIPYFSKATTDKIRRDNEMESYVPPYDADDPDDGKKKRKKKEKDPNAPKRNLSAYFFFAKDVRPTVVADLAKEGIGNKVTDVMRRVAARWNTLGEQAKAGNNAEASAKLKECQDLATKDQQRYKDESDAYNRKQQQQQVLLQQQRQQQQQRQYQQPQNSSTSYQHPQQIDDDDEDDEEYEEEYEE